MTITEGIFEALFLELRKDCDKALVGWIDYLSLAFQNIEHL